MYLFAEVHIDDRIDQELYMDAEEQFPEQLFYPYELVSRDLHGQKLPQD
jgi:hypothetical protein